MQIIGIYILLPAIDRYTYLGRIMKELVIDDNNIVTISIY